MSNRRRHERGPDRINNEPYRCVCQPGADAHQEHTKPGRVAAKHFDPRCPHWDRTSVPIIVHHSARRMGKPVLNERIQLEAVPLP